jgi:hypothetical protein
MWLEVLLLAAAIWLLSTTVSRAKIFFPLRYYCNNHCNPILLWIGEAISCQYCLSHWIGAAIVWWGRINFFNYPELFTYCMTWAALVGVANVIGRTVGRADEQTRKEIK